MPEVGRAQGSEERPPARRSQARSRRSGRARSATAVAGAAPRNRTGSSWTVSLRDPAGGNSGSRDPQGTGSWDTSGTLLSSGLLPFQKLLEEAVAIGRRQVGRWTAL